MHCKQASERAHVPCRVWRFIFLVNYYEISDMCMNKCMETFTHNFFLNVAKLSRSVLCAKQRRRECMSGCSFIFHTKHDFLHVTLGNVLHYFELLVAHLTTFYRTVYATAVVVSVWLIDLSWIFYYALLAVFQMPIDLLELSRALIRQWSNLQWI